MAENVIAPGSLVKGYAGRDKGKYFVVVNIVNERYVLLINGTTRKKNNLKLKNIKHVRSSGLTINKIIDNFDTVTDAEISKLVAEYVGRL